MLENEAKGWYGSYSLAGRRSAENFNNILHKNEILKGENKKIKITDLFAPDEVVKLNRHEEKLDIYKIYSLSGNTLKKKIIQKYKEDEEPKEKKGNKKFNLFYHNRHCSLENKKVGASAYEPGCTRYSPNYNYIWPKLITGIKWGDQMGRKKKKEQIDKRDFIINNLENYDKYVINSGFVKCFVNMNNNKKKKILLLDKNKINNTFSRNRKKTITRKKVPQTADNFHKINQSSEIEKMKTKDTEIFVKKNKLNNIIKDDYFSPDISKINNISTPGFNKNNFGKTTKNFFTESNVLKNLKNKNNLMLESVNEEESISQINKVKIKGPAPIFSKFASREKKKKTHQIENIPFVFPKYSFVQERSLTMAVYKKPKPTKVYKPIPFEGMMMGLDYDPDKVIEKYNNHQSPKVPIFKYMTSRPNKKGSPLPSFLQGVHDRSAPYLTTDKSLLFNNFAEGKYIPASSSFFPKKSYNKIINTKMAYTKMFKEESTDEDIQNKKKRVFEKLKLDGADYEELKKEGALDKFDNFCYKSILRKKPKENIKDLLISFECEEENEEKKK